MASAPAQPADQVLLIVPGGLGDGPALRVQAQAAGSQVVGASSVKDDPAGAQYPAWAWLPHVASPDFEVALADLIERLGVGRIHATHYLVWAKIKAILDARSSPVTLTRGRTFMELEDEYRLLRQRVEAAEPAPELAAAAALHPPLKPIEAAGFLRAAMAIPGESYEPKLMAMIELGRHVPPGDLVEIGCLFGRTAALLAMLARRYDLGQVLCVDPWSRDELDQGADALREPSQDYDWDEWRRMFEINLAPFAQGRLNYIRATGELGGAAYAQSRTVVTPAFGEHRYEGRIGLLHIDGNHEYGHVLADVRAWAPFVQPGGWIIFDDYEWDWGDGVRRVADGFTGGHAVRTRFLVAGALFVQLGG